MLASRDWQGIIVSGSLIPPLAEVLPTSPPHLLLCCMASHVEVMHLAPFIRTVSASSYHLATNSTS